MKIALRSSDPYVLNKCWLFVAMSLMQQGQLQKSKYIIYQIHNSVKEHDPVLSRMCKGIWARLQYTWKEKIKDKNWKHATKQFANEANIVFIRSIFLASHCNSCPLAFFPRIQILHLALTVASQVCSRVWILSSHHWLHQGHRLLLCQGIGR